MMTASLHRMVRVAPTARSGALPLWAERLGAAQSLVEITRCFFALEEPPGYALELFGDTGCPLVVIASVASAEAGWARAYMAGAWVEDPALTALKSDHTVVAFADLGPDDEPGILVGPLVRGGRLIGTLRFQSRSPLAPRTREVAQAVCAHVSVRLAELGFAPPRTRGPLALLTERQREVAAFVAAGYGTTEIALALGVSPNTIKKHLKLIFETLGLNTRAELAVIASRIGASLHELDAAHADLHVEWAVPKKP